MGNVSKIAICAVLAATFGFAPMAAQADLVSFTYSDLDGDFAVGGADSGTFSAADQLTTQGDVTRIAAPIGSAAMDFSDAGIGSGDFTMSVAVSNVTSTTADGLGTFSLTDVNGDTLSGTISGIWLRAGDSANFVGLVSGAMFAGGDGTFMGTDGGSFSTVFTSPAPYPGNIIALAFGGWFTDANDAVAAFDDKTTLVSGAIVPAPGAALLGMIGFGAVGRIKRRFA